MVAFLLAVLAVAGVTACGSSSNESCAPTIDGDRLTSAELALPAGGDSGPYTSANAASRLDALRTGFATLAVARYLRVTEVRRPDDIIGRLGEVNADRHRQQIAGTPVYGPLTYDAATLVSATLAQIRQAAVNAVTSAVTDAQTRARFDADPAAWAQAQARFGMTRYSLPGPDRGGLTPAAAAALAAGPASAIAARPGVVMSSMTVTSPAAPGGIWSPDAVAALASARVGTVIGPLTDQGAWVFLRVDSTSSDPVADYAHYRTRIAATIASEEVDRRIAASRDSQKICPT